jgi:SAM-dependent methyltransferase
MSTSENGIGPGGLGMGDWAGDMGRNWLANLNRFEAMIQPIGAELIRQAAFRPGENVIDIGCGGGATTIALARSLSPSGSATGLDISRELIDHAGVRASMGTQSRIFWICGDASTVMPTNAPFDRLISRFGTMFFSDPVAAFRNLRAMLKDGARVDLAVWAPQQDNPWILTIMGALKPFMAQEPGAPPPDPRTPGPFAFADTDYLADILTQAGFADMKIEPCVRDQPIGGPGATPEQAAQFVLSAMSVAANIPEEKREETITAVAAALAPHHVPGKGVILGGKAWIVTAKAV